MNSTNKRVGTQKYKCHIYCSSSSPWLCCGFPIDGKVLFRSLFPRGTLSLRVLTFNYTGFGCCGNDFHCLPIYMFEFLPRIAHLLFYSVGDGVRWGRKQVGGIGEASSRVTSLSWYPGQGKGWINGPNSAACIQAVSRSPLGIQCHKDADQTCGGIGNGGGRERLGIFHC